MEKMTNKKALEFVLGLNEVKENKEVFDKVAKMLEQVEKKNGSGKSDKPTKAQLENEKIKVVILDVLARMENAVQIKELLLEDELSEFTNQKLSALVRQMVATGSVVRIEEKKVTKFKIA